MQCTAKELGRILTSFKRISTTFEPFNSPSEVGCKSQLLNELIDPLPRIRRLVDGFLEQIDTKKASENEIADLWVDEEKFPAITNAKFVCCLLSSPKLGMERLLTIVLSL